MAIFTVSDSAGLYEALANATGGDKIKLEAGDYGSLNLWAGSGFDVTFDSPVTITSKDPEARASFSEVHLNGVANLTFDNVVFDYTFDSLDPIWGEPFSVDGSTNIAFQNSLFDGDVASGLGTLDDGYGFAKGLAVVKSTGISVTDNEFTTWHRGLVIGGSKDILVSGNDVHSVRSDGLNFAAVQSVVIEDNYIHDFSVPPGATDHEDMIQFWTSGTSVPSTDIIIRGNTLDIGDGTGSQSIFMRNEVVDGGYAGSEMYYQNILIEENIILNAHINGIIVGETDGLTIRNNSVLSVPSLDPRYYSAPSIGVASASNNVTIEANAVAAISGNSGQSDWLLSNNAYIQNTDRDAPGYYADVFLESTNEGRDSIWTYVVAPGGMIDNLSAGASQLLLDTTPDTVTPHFEITSNIDTLQTLVFDATHTYGPVGQVLSTDATFTWDFGDGNTATGRIVEHNYDTVGQHNVTLKVLLNGQDITTAATAYAEVSIAGEDVLAFKASDGSFYLESYGSETAIVGSDLASVSAGGEKFVDLSGTGVKLEIPKEGLLQFFGSDAFEMSMTLQANQPGTSWGEVLRIHDSLIVGVRGDGDLYVDFFPDTAGVVINATTSSIAINDGLAHDISVRFDDATNSLQILVDGSVAVSEEAMGSVRSMGSWGLTFGDPWGEQNFDGKLSAFDLNVATKDYPAFEGALEGPTTDPVSDPVPDDPTDETSLPTLDDFVSDFAQLTAKQLHDDAYVTTTGSDSEVHLDGDDDYVNLGRLTEFENSQQLSFSVDFQRGTVDGGRQRIVMNQKKIALDVDGDGLEIRVKQVDTGFKEAISIDNLGLDDTDLHQVIVMIDAVTDRLQVVLDGALVLDKQDSDIELVGIGPERGWKIGTQWKADFDGEVHDFRMDASAEFVSEQLLVSDDASLVV